VDSNHAELFTAICAASFAGAAFAATDVRLDRTAIPNFYPFIVLGDAGNDPGKLVSQNSRIGVRRMSTCEGMEITSAHSDGANPYQGLSTRDFG
jgi:hypothetical protein